MNYEFLKDLIGSPWQIEPQTLNRFYPVFKGLFSGLQIEKGEEPFNHRQQALSAVTKDFVPQSWSTPEPPIPDEHPEQGEQQTKVINVLPIRSILTKHDQMCGPVGTRTLAARLMNADAGENVIGHILVIESGGGQAVAVPELAEAIQNCTKPVVAWIDGLAASAAYYIASYAKEIIASRDLDMVGCIGTMIQWEGRKSKSTENEEGEVSVTIYADGSDEKNQEYETAINEFNFTLAKERLLNPFNAKFLADVKINRPAVLPEQLKGRTFYAQDVVGTLIDSIGSFEIAVDRILSLSNFSNKPVAKDNSQETNTPNEMKQFSHLNSLLNVEAFESTAEGVFLNEEQLTSVEERLEANQQLVAERETAVQERDTATTSLATLTETLGTVQSMLDTAQTALAAALDPFNAIDPAIAAAETPEAKAAAIRTLLSAKPGAKAVQTLGQEDDHATEEVDWETINSLPHNQQVDINS